PDCRPEYLAAFQAMANLATTGAVTGRLPVTIHAPLLNRSKAQIITLGRSLGVDFSLTLSCYDPDPNARACGACESCILRRKGFLEAGVEDPASYRE
ncbi:MAG: 7-cyano-7-deazaguanine synthase, partial [Deltaproteobacteria bacterium]|nr:7-cyano-7-deazaguanine synthase [Deltaproteobacteria bacterium]